MKALFRILTVILTVASLLPAADLQGNVSGTLKRAQSPYVAKGDLIVPADAQLIIEPGVVLLFDTTMVFRVEGTLKAVGSATRPIVFKSVRKNAKGAAWEGIRLTNLSSNATQLKFCRIENARRGISLFSVSPTISHCDVLNSAEDGILCDVSAAILRNNRIAGNGQNGIHAIAFKGLIADNEISTNGADGIYLEKSHCTVRNNTIRKNKDDGLFCLNSDGTVKNNLFVQNGDDGILLGNSSPVIFNNVISRCDFGLFGYKKSKPSVVNCTIAGNKYGLYARDTTQFQVENSILWNNEQTAFADSVSHISVRYSDVEGGFAGKGNFSRDPQFSDENFTQLSPQTPCNKGANPVPVYKQSGFPVGVVGARLKQQGK